MKCPFSVLWVNCEFNFDLLLWLKSVCVVYMCMCVTFALAISENGHYMRRDKWQVLIHSNIINWVKWKTMTKNYVSNMTLCKMESIYLVLAYDFIIMHAAPKVCACVCVLECVWVMLSKMFAFAVKWNQLEINRPVLFRTALVMNQFLASR